MDNKKTVDEMVRDAIRNAVEGATFEQAKPQLPNGIEWPRFEDGELVKFGDKYVDGDSTVTVCGFLFDRNGFSIYVSSSGTGEYAYGTPVKRPKQDTLEDIQKDAEEFVNSLGDGRNATYVLTLLERQRKLMGGE